MEKKIASKKYEKTLTNLGSGHSKLQPQNSYFSYVYAGHGHISLFFTYTNLALILLQTLYIQLQPLKTASNKLKKNSMTKHFFGLGDEEENLCLEF